ncbi:hypothetical protein [Paenibacillus illinoisensis]|uniref:hypothetical protein n=1 Tax=Paenibacillus illinoisensis TaxID=59845 RepID=UPI0030184B93
MSVVDSHMAGTAPDGVDSAAGRAVPPIAKLLESATIRYLGRPVFLSRGTYVLVTRELVEEQPFVWHEGTGRMYEWNQIQVNRVDDPMLEPSLQLYHIQVPIRAEQDDTLPKEPVFDTTDLMKQMLQFRVELCRAGLEQVRVHLSSRTSGGQSTLQHQLVKGMIADILTVLYLAETVPSGQFAMDQAHISPERTITWVHRELDEAFRHVQRLGGGFGYLRQGISAYVYTGQLIKNMMLTAREDDQ